MKSTRDLNEYGLPQPSAPREEHLPAVNGVLNLALNAELNYDILKEFCTFTDNHALFNIEQRIAFETIHSFIANNTTGGIFLDAPGGTGKTFLFNTLLSKFRSSGDIVVAVSSSGISAMLLAGGRTAHQQDSPFLLYACTTRTVQSI